MNNNNVTPFMKNTAERINLSWETMISFFHITEIKKSKPRS